MVALSSLQPHLLKLAYRVTWQGNNIAKITLPPSKLDISDNMTCLMSFQFVRQLILVFRTTRRMLNWKLLTKPSMRIYPFSRLMH